MIQTSIIQHAKNVTEKCDKALNTMSTNSDETEYFFSKKIFDKIPSISIDYSCNGKS